MASDLRKRRIRSYSTSVTCPMTPPALSARRRNRMRSYVRLVVQGPYLEEGVVDRSLNHCGVGRCGGRGCARGPGSPMCVFPATQP